jgi:hypothetical protein
VTSLYERAVLEVVSSCPGPVEVSGDGERARRLTELVGGHPSGAGQVVAPGTVIDTTGTAEGLQRAFARVAALGTVILAGPEPIRPVALDLHDDVHVRGLTIIGLGAQPG